MRSQGKISTAHLDQLESQLYDDTLNVDGDSVVRFAEFLSPGSQHLADGVGADDLLRVGAKRGDLGSTMHVVKDSNGDVAWLERGRLTTETKQSDRWIHDDGGAGWAHIRHNRIDSPSGNEFLRYGDEFENPKKVRKLIVSAVENGDRKFDGDDIWYVYEVPGTNGKYVSVLVGNNGYIVTAIPSKVV